ncbi:hypothetical protein AVM02_04530 [Brucella anthropi]|uniref:hypothetical protein n=1 Tax=Brucella anthropi TaxID=529 RepID=UPI0039885070
MAQLPVAAPDIACQESSPHAHGGIVCLNGIVKVNFGRVFCLMLLPIKVVVSGGLRDMINDG